MKIDRLRIGNCARLPDLDIAVRRHLVLVGPNDGGKTSVLRCLDAVLRAPLSELYRWAPDLIRDGKEPMTVEVELCGFDDDDRASFCDEIELRSQGGDEFEERLTIRLEVGAVADDADDAVIERRAIKEGVRSPLRSAQLRALGWSYLRALRSADAELGGRGGAVRALLREIDLGPDEVELRQAIEDFDSALSAATSLRKLRGDVAAALNDVYPFAVTEDDVSVSLPRDDEDDLLEGVTLQVARGATQTGLGDQSDGLRAMSTVAMHRLARRSARIAAVDEPEIHLHPRSQALIGRVLASSTSQVAVATHSPAVLASFSPSDVVVIRADQAVQVTDHSLDDDWRFLGHHWLDATLEPLTAVAVVLVEGVSDRILTHAVAEAMDFPLDRLGVSVVAVHGATSFKPVIRLFGPTGFRIPLHTLVDDVETPIVAKALGCEVGELNANGVVVCNPDLEEECVRGLGVQRHADLLTLSGLYEMAHIRAACGNAPSIDAIDATLYVEFCRGDKVRIAAALAVLGHQVGDARRLMGG